MSVVGFVLCCTLEITSVVQYRHFRCYETGNNTGLHRGLEEREVFLDSDRRLVCVG